VAGTRASSLTLLAVPVGVVGFALAGTLLATSLDPTSWTPVVDPVAGASVTDVGDLAVDRSPVLVVAD
jgi:hypothetical protein